MHLGAGLLAAYVSSQAQLVRRTADYVGDRRHLLALTLHLHSEFGGRAVYLWLDERAHGCIERGEALLDDEEWSSLETPDRAPLHDDIHSVRELFGNLRTHHILHRRCIFLL